MASPGYAITSHDDLLSIYSDLRSRYQERDNRHDAITKMLRREWDLKDSAGDPLLIASANMIKTALEDISEAAATMPTIRVRPTDNKAGSVKQAAQMERVGLSYASANKLRSRMPRFVMDHLAYGFTPFIVLPDQDTQQPMIYKRNPRTTFPEMPIYPSMIPKRVMFSEQVPFAGLDTETQALLISTGYQKPTKNVRAQMLIRMEYVTDDMYVQGWLYSTNRVLNNNDSFVTAAWTPVIETITELKAGVTPAVIIPRDTFDDQHRGLFDDVIDPQLGHAKLLAMAIDYADQAVYSDTWARDVLGDVAYGGGSFIELGPNGAIGRVPPASSGLDLWRDVDKLEEGIHLGSRWPKTRPGDIDQSIASGKFVEATVGTMNTVLKVVHEKFGEGLEDLIYLCFKTDVAYFGDKEQKATGHMAGEDFAFDYVPNEVINFNHDLNIEYGLGLGRDPSESAMLMMNYAEKELLSDEFVQENTEGLHDIQRERQRIDLQKVGKMMFASLLAAIEAGEIGKEVLTEVYRRREKGDPMVDILEDVFTPEEEPEMSEEELMAQAAGMGSGPPGAEPMPPPPPEIAALMGGGGMPPGMGAGPPGGMPPGMPPGAMPPGGNMGPPAGVPVGV